jgi:hypothetical protein
MIDGGRRMGEVSKQVSEMSSPASLRTYQHRSVTYHIQATAQITTMNATLVPRFSNTRTTATCSLCHESPAADVATHLDGEDEAIGEPTFAMIKVLHPDWLEDRGACAACWSFYRNLVRVLNASGCFDTRFRIGGRRGNASVNPNEDDQRSLQFQRSKA